MGVAVLVLGESGNGKSTSLRNFKPDEVGIFNVAAKPLPFRGKLPKIDRPSYSMIKAGLKANSCNCYIIDDANYLLSFENFQKAKETGYGKFIDMAQSFEQMLEAIMNTSDDTITYVLMHPEYDVNGRMKPKLVGKMLDEKLCVEGLFPIVLIAKRDDEGYWFVTKTDGNTPAKAPMGMFDEEKIPNDLKAVDDVIREYWGLGPIKPEEGEK